MDNKYILKMLEEGKFKELKKQFRMKYIRKSWVTLREQSSAMQP